MTSKTNPICRVCGTELNEENWYSSRQKNSDYICKSCHAEKSRQWLKANPEKAKARWTRWHRKQGQQPFDENKKCASYLGVYIAEWALSQAFKNVKRMPVNNPGFDLICNKGKIDVKSACLRKDSRWQFHIDHNTIADYFLCLAFDNREDLNPMYAWLIPGVKVNHLVSTTIAVTTIHKWDAYKLDVTKVAMCCDAIK